MIWDGFASTSWLLCAGDRAKRSQLIPPTSNVTKIETNESNQIN